jgi:hypothetical protein
MRKFLVGNYGVKWQLLRLAAIIAGVVVAQLVIADGHAHIYGKGKNMNVYQEAFYNIKVPRVGHVYVTEKFQWPCGHVAGCTWEGTQLVYINPGNTGYSKRHVFYHEIGHQYDMRVLDETDRLNLRKVMGYPVSWGWWDRLGGGRGAIGEQFAEAYAWCAMGKWPAPEEPTGYGYHPTPEQHAATCAVILSTDDEPT